MLKVISTEKAPAAIGPYSQAMVFGNLMISSGQIPIDPATGEIAGTRLKTGRNNGFVGCSGQAKSAQSDGSVE